MSGLSWREIECHLPSVVWRGRLWGSQGVDGPSVHEIEAHEPCELDRFADGVLAGLGGFEDEVGDQGDEDLDAHGIFGARHVLSEGARSHLRSPPIAARLVAKLHAAGLDAQPSVDAGDYVCNATLWRSLEAGASPAVFIHLPKKRHAAPRKVATALARILPAVTVELARSQAARRRANPEPQ